LARFGEEGGQAILIPSGGGNEVIVTSPLPGFILPTDWSLDGKWLLASVANQASDAQNAEISRLPVDEEPRAEKGAEVLASDPDLNLWQSRFSPDDRWIAFVAVEREDPEGVASIFVMPGKGGDWIQVTEDRYWNDKPRWAPDGKMLYFATTRGGFLNIWGIRFDPNRGQPIGEPFAVTNFQDPSHFLYPNMPEMEIALSQNRLVMPILEVIGENIWVLEDVDQ